MKSLVRKFLGDVHGRQGVLARANGTFFSAQVVSIAIQRIRLSMLDGAELTLKGHEFVQGAAAYLNWLAYSSVKKRGLSVSTQVSLTGNTPRMSMTVKRQRNSETESYTQHILDDVYALLLRPPASFSSVHNTFYTLNSLTLPTPEYLYLYGVYLMQSARAEGNWPRGDKIGGLSDDFTASRALLVDDLHRDICLPLDHEPFRTLSWWVVFPPYGWEMNDGQEYNMMTLVDQIAITPILPANDGIAYLHALLTAQMLFIRYLAARTLLILGIAPRHPADTRLYQASLQANDYPVAVMARLQWSIEHSDTEPPSDWEQQCSEQWQSILQQAPTPVWHDDAIFALPEYQRLNTLDPEDNDSFIRVLRPLFNTMPENWFVRAALGARLMQGEAPEEGEKMLRDCLADSPSDCPDAYINLGTRLKWQGRKIEAMKVFEQAVQRWPWHSQSVESCMVLLTDDMVYFPDGD